MHIYLGEERFPVVCDHRALALQGYCYVVEGFFYVFHVVVEFRDATFEYTSEVPRY